MKSSTAKGFSAGVAVSDAYARHARHAVPQVHSFIHSLTTTNYPIRAVLPGPRMPSHSIPQVDPVRIDKVAQAGSPAEVGGRIVALEGKKEGVSKVELLASSADGDYYAFDYAVESTRGRNRYLAR